MKNKEKKFYDEIMTRFEDGTYNHLPKIIKKDVEFLKYVMIKTDFLDCSSSAITISQRLWHIINDIYVAPKCQECEKIAKFFRINKGYLKSCSKKCGNSSVRNSRGRQTRKERYGNENYNNRDKFKTTNEERYGGHFANLESIKKKKKATKLLRYGDEKYVNKEKGKQTKKEKYGDENYNNREKAKETCLERYGVENQNNLESVRKKVEDTMIERYGCKSPMQNEHIREKCRNTCVEKYGVEHPSQNSEIYSKIRKSSFSLKPYVFPSGKTVMIQGYENKTLDIILNAYNESDVYVCDDEIKNFTGEIWYNFNGGLHRYFPDLYIKSSNTIIETKSVWTYMVDLEQNFYKEKKCIELGYKFELYIFNGNGKKITEEECFKLFIDCGNYI